MKDLRKSLNERLIGLLREHSYKQAPPGQPFTLASGAKSDYFIDVKATALLGEGHWVLGHILCDALWRGWIGVDAGYQKVDAVAGVELGGCPLASAVSALSSEVFESPKGINSLYVRKAAKDHGTGKLIEGTVTPGMKVVLLEDVFTTGGSSLKAIKTLQEAGCAVVGVIGVVDREQGAAEAFRDAGVRFESIVRISDLRS